jgi:hypothetical protein
MKTIIALLKQTPISFQQSRLTYQKKNEMLKISLNIVINQTIYKITNQIQRMFRKNEIK